MQLQYVNQAGLLEGRNFTCYDGVQGTKIANGHYHKETVVVDGNVITQPWALTALHLAPWLKHWVEMLSL